MDYHSLFSEYLAYCFSIQQHNPEDHEERFSLYSELTDVTGTVSSNDLSAAKAWVNAAEDFHHSTTLPAYETALRLLVQHLTTFPSLPQHLTVIRSLTSSLAADAFSAGLRCQSSEKAVELLEQGRGVFWSQLIRLRSPLDDVVEYGPAGRTLADEFKRLTSAIRNAFDSPGPDQHDRVCHLNLELQDVVSNIRDLRGLSRFLLPSLFPDLQAAAKGGAIIVINASKYSCDALIVFADKDPVHIPLSITQENVRGLSSKFRALTVDARKMNLTRDLFEFLEKLWDSAISPIAGVLLRQVRRQSRIWWCPTADFCLLPLHAAGPYEKGRENLADMFISSYTPTLSALIRARGSNLPEPTTQAKWFHKWIPRKKEMKVKHFIAIGLVEAPGQRELPSVVTELANIKQSIDDLATFTSIEGQEACVSRVIEELGKNEWVHLACHGLPDKKQPFKSAFALHDGHLTIQRLTGCNLANAEFAYLSACHTAAGDEGGPDEVIHLAAAMQFTGFRSVIGSMWEVGDYETTKIAPLFYKYMVDESGCLDYTRAAFALWKTMKSLRSGESGTSLKSLVSLKWRKSKKLEGVPLHQQILYIHIGV